VFKESLEKSLRESHSNLWTEHAFLLHCEMDLFDEWMKSRANFIVEGQYKDQALILYYLNRLIEKPKATQLIEEKRGFPLESIRPDEVVTFDTYLRMNKNNKFIKYFKRNTVAHKSRLENL